MHTLTTECSAFGDSVDFVKAFAMGFELRVRKERLLIASSTDTQLPRPRCTQDAIALLRLDDLYLDSFEVKDGEHTEHTSVT